MWAFTIKHWIHVERTNFLPLRQVFIVIRVRAWETNPYARVNLYEMSTNKSCWRWSVSPLVSILNMHELVETAPANDTFIAKRKSRWPCDACVIHARFTRDEIINLAPSRGIMPNPFHMHSTAHWGGGGGLGGYIEGEVSFRCRCGWFFSLFNILRRHFQSGTFKSINVPEKGTFCHSESTCSTYLSTKRRSRINGAPN